MEESKQVKKCKNKSKQKEVKKLSKGIILKILDEERKREFIGIFGTNEVYITSPVPISINTMDGPKMAYFLDLSLITQEQRSKLIESISKKFKLEKEFVEENMEKHGVPILSDHTSMSCYDSGAFFNAFGL